MSNINGYCPHCNADLDGELVIDYPLSQGKSREEALEYAACYAGWDEHGEANRWGRAISLYCIDRDRTIEHGCPDCSKTWGEEVMPHHYWGDKDFDWDSLYKAIEEADTIMSKYGRIGVHSKEKFGTARWSLYLCNGSLHSFTHPGYMYSQYPKWLWSFDVMNEPLKYVAPIIRFWQKLVIQYAFTTVCAKYPHIRDEIINDAPKELLPCELAIACAKMWSNSCSHCGEMSTTDNYKCPHCGEVK